MPTNRSSIDHISVIRPAQLVDKGLPLPLLSGKLVVDDGWVAVVTEGGAFKEILHPGHHSAARYRLFRDVKATLVDTRVQTLSVVTTREFAIGQPVPVKVNLDLAVEYRISDARRVAFEVSEPLLKLYDRVIEAVRGAVVHATIDEVRTQGEGIARTTLQRLQAMQLSKLLGIEVFHVLVTRIQPTDTAGDALGSQEFKEYTQVRDWRMDQQMTQNTQVTWTWLLMNRPEVAQQLIAQHGAMAQKMLEEGYIDPASVLNTPVMGSQLNAGPMLDPLGLGSPQAPGQRPPAGPGAAPPAGGAPPLGAGPADINARMSDEVSLLKQQISGIAVKTKPGLDPHGIPDGSFDLLLTFPSASGRQIRLFINCPRGYPTTPPLVDVEFDGQDVPYQSAVLQRWNGHYLLELAREVRSYFG